MNGRTQASRTTLLFLALSAVAAGAMDWPSPETRGVSSFGQNEAGRPSVGYGFSGEGTVRSADAGEVVYARGPQDGIDGFPSPLGSWIAVDHADGIVAVYGRLADFEAENAKTVVEKGSVLGRAGKSGWTDESGFFFSILDRSGRKWVNPALIIPFVADKKPPVLRSVLLIGRDGIPVNAALVKSVRQGSYRILVDAVDAEDRSVAYPLAPQHIICVVNGSEQGALHLETIQTVEGALRVMRIALSPAAAAYEHVPAYDLGEARLTRGRAHIEITVRDAVGNERSSAFSIIVE